MASAPLVLLIPWLLFQGVSTIAISTISATNETTVSNSDDRCLDDEPACSCSQPAIMKCFCPSEAYALHFRFDRLDTPFDLLQIGACRQLTLFGQPFSSHPPEFVQIFDSDNVFHDPTFASSPPVSPLPVTPYPALVTAARPIRRIEFLNVTLSYLALGDFYALNRIEQFIIQNSTVKVLGGRPPEAPHASNMGSIQLLSSLFLEVRKGALDVVGVDAFLLTNSTVHSWRAGGVRLLTNEEALLVISNCSVHRMEATALSLLAAGRQAALLVEGNRFERLADDAFRLLDAGRVDFRFLDNRLDDVRPRALVALRAAGSADVSANLFPCQQPLCWGDDGFRQGASNKCWKPANDSDDVIVMVNFTAALLPTDEACRLPAILDDDEGQRPSTTRGGAALDAPRVLLTVASLLIAVVLSFMDDPI